VVSTDRITECKRTNSLGASLAETGNRTGFWNLVLFKILDGGQSSRQEDCVS